jgi:hypothetical protein
MGGALALGSFRALAQDMAAPTARLRDDVFVTLREPELFPRLPSAPGLPISGHVEVPWWGRIATDGRFAGTTRYQASDGKSLIVICRATMKIGPVQETRDVVLTFRNDPSNAKQLLFKSRMVDAVDDALIRSLPALTLDHQIDALLRQIGEGNDTHGVPKKPESSLAIEPSTDDQINLRRLKKGKPAEEVTISIRPEGTRRTMSFHFEGYALDVQLSP